MEICANIFEGATLFTTLLILYFYTSLGQLLLLAFFVLFFSPFNYIYFSVIKNNSIGVERSCNDHGLVLYSMLPGIMCLTVVDSYAKSYFVIALLSNIFAIFELSAELVLRKMSLEGFRLKLASISVAVCVICSNYILKLERYVAKYLSLHHPFQRKSIFQSSLYFRLSILLVLSCFLLKRVTKSFSIGEALMVSLMFTLNMEKIVSFMSSKESIIDLDCWWLSAVLFCFILLPWVVPFNLKIQLSHNQPFAKNLTFIILCAPLLLGLLYLQLFMALVVSFSFLYYSLEKEPVRWLFYFLSQMRKSSELIIFWACLLLSALGFTITVSSISSKPADSCSKTRLRKIYHLFIVAVFHSGIAINARVLSIASSLCLFLFVAMEFIRAYRLPPFGKILFEKLSVFADKQDNGCLLLTPIYLLISMCIPIWIYPHNVNDRNILLYAGVLSVGVGDTVASIYGSKYGKFRLKGNRKSLDATFVAILSILIVTLALEASGSLVLDLSLDRYFTAVTATMLLEYSTQQIDNLVLTPFFYGVLSILKEF